MDVLKVEGGALYQWDTGRRVVVNPAEGCTVSEAHFANPDGDDALIVELKTENGRIFAPIPNILLHGSGHIHVFATIVTADGRRTICDKIFNIRPRQKPSDYVYTETEVYSIKTALEKTLREAKESGEFNGPEGKPGKDGKDGVDGKDGANGKDGADGKDGLSEWDHVITSADLTSIDPTTNEKVFDITKLATMLATMRGRVLVKGINYQPEFEYGDALNITIPSSISLIEFIDSTIFANITAKGSCKIIGFVGHNQYYFQFSSLTGFSWVEKCRGQLELYNCQNVIHSEIRSASLCNNLQDINASTDESDMFTITFNGCNLIDGVQVSTIGHDSDVEFQSCKNISNVRNLTPTFASIKYNGCTFVDGDTCDGYYTSADVGKVKTITNDGTTQLISPEEMGGGGTSAYDFVLEDEELWSDSLNGMSGDILVKGGIVMYSLSVPKEVKSIRFIATECLYEMIAGEIATPCTIYGHSSTKISGVEGDYVNLYSFGTVEDCHGIITLSHCSNISRCTLASLDLCSYVSKIRRGNDIEKVTYSNCKYVDGDTCQDFYSDEDVGKVKTVGPDGSASLANCGKVYMHVLEFEICGADDTGICEATDTYLTFILYSAKSEPFESIFEIPYWDLTLPQSFAPHASHADLGDFSADIARVEMHEYSDDDGNTGLKILIYYRDTFNRYDDCYIEYGSLNEETWLDYSDWVVEV